MNRFFAMTGVALLTAGLMLAHEARLHGANAFIGEVTAVTGKGLQLKTKTGIVTVNYSSKTKFEMNEKPSNKKALKVGDKVGVAGSKLPSGEVMANEVLIGYVDPPAPEKAEKKATEHKHDAQSDHKHDAKSDHKHDAKSDHKH
jgi:hypothetical protein